MSKRLCLANILVLKQCQRQLENICFWHRPGFPLSLASLLPVFRGMSVFSALTFLEVSNEHRTIWSTSPGSVSWSTGFGKVWKLCPCWRKHFSSEGQFWQWIIWHYFQSAISESCFRLPKWCPAVPDCLSAACCPASTLPQWTLISTNHQPN